MDQKVFIFIGRSGCGKGTQVKLLLEHLKKIDSQRNVLYIQSGNEFREFIKGQSATQKLSYKAYEDDNLQPEFLSIYMWANVLINKYSGNEHIIFDGSPRRKHEAGVMDSIFDFYNFKKPCVIHLDVSEEWATEKLTLRHRMDDKSEDIKKRLLWYKTDVIPAIDFYKNNPRYKFLNINGERSIEEISKEIINLI